MGHPRKQHTAVEVQNLQDFATKNPATQDRTEMFLLQYKPRYDSCICLLAAPESISQGRL